MAIEKQLFINSIRQIRIQGSVIVPTTILYQGQKCLVGLDAINASYGSAELKEDFKVEIGNDTPLNLARRTSTSHRSTLGIAKDFIDSVLGEALSNIELQGFQRPTRILVAEPLSLRHDTLAHEEWLQNYRKSLKGILSGKFPEIDFMPEPFAVFQYYRYGVRHALVAQKQKHVALVFDFGGGTFDASVVETTASGDISQGGRNSKPLAARSIPFGGFAINRIIADALQARALDRGVDKSALTKARERFAELKNLDEDELSSNRYAAFTRNYKRLLQSVEQAKIAVCSGITNWRLDSNLQMSPACPVEVPTRPLDDGSPLVPIRLEPSELRSLFEDVVWKQKLLPAIRETLKGANRELEGKPISVVLLSGGSSNFRWIKPLVQRDLGNDLGNSEILELNENFQEIVAKGLAVECARRFYTEGQGDFRAVTYNRLCLVLSPNGLGLEIRPFIPESPELEGLQADPGVLLPSSTSLKGLIDQPLRWKVRLTKAPNHVLDYYFLRSAFDPEEASARHNLDSRVLTPRDTKFGSSVSVELTVREDGTTSPTFTYGHGTQGHNTIVRGKPFYLDMTFAGEAAGGDTYLGFDFGTSTSSICYVDASDIKIYADREQSQVWHGLSSLIEMLPYPVAYPLARYLAETSQQQMERWGRELLEAMLTIVTYISYCENCAVTKPGNTFKGLSQRSAGPLWHTFKLCAQQSKSKWVIGKDLTKLLEPALFAEIDEAVSQIALVKHGKLPGNTDYPRLLEKVGNVLVSALSGKIFGFFEDTLPKAFSTNVFRGIFRNARGSHGPFIDVYDYEGAYAFPKEFMFVVDLESGNCLPLFPVFVRGLEASNAHAEERDIYCFDIARAKSGSIAFRAVQERPEFSITKEGVFRELFDAISGLLIRDNQVEVLSGIRLSRRAV